MEACAWACWAEFADELAGEIAMLAPCQFDVRSQQCALASSGSVPNIDKTLKK